MKRLIPILLVSCSVCPALAAEPASAEPEPLQSIPRMEARTTNKTRDPGLFGDYWWANRFLHKRQEAEAYYGKSVDVVLVGDSITHFWEWQHPECWRRFTAKRTALNLGYGGDRTQNVIWRIEHGELDGYRAKNIVLMIGTNNNAARSSKPEVVAQAVEKIVGMIRERQPSARLILHPIFPRGASADAPEHGEARLRNEKTNAILKEFVEKDGRIVWVDFNDKLVDASGWVPKSIMADQIHPTDAGYEIWRKALEPALCSEASAAEGRGQQIPLGVNEYDFLVYRPKQEFDSRQFGDISRRGDAYNDHFQVIWDAKRRLMYAFWTQASWEGAPDSHICFAKSADKGRTWSEPVLLAGSETRRYPRPEAYYQQPMLAKTGRLYCLWTERHVPQGMVGTYSDDAGRTWAATKVMGVRRADQDPADLRVCPNYINWQCPLRLGKDGRFFVGSSHHGKAPYDKKAGCKINFWEFLNIDENPEVNAIRLDYFAWDRQALGVEKLPKGGNWFVPQKYPNGQPEGPAVEEAAIVKLPDGRLFALMRSSVGSPVWSQSRDGGRTWSDLKALVDANGKPFPHPRSPCPIYDRGGDGAASGEYFAFIHNTFDFKSTTACQPRPQLYLIAGKFDPTGEQPIRFSAPKLFCKRTFGNSLYSSYTVADGEAVLWFPDVKYYLLGRKIGDEWFK